MSGRKQVGAQEVLVEGPHELTADWLGRALGTGVTAVGVTAIGTGQTGSSYRLEATYAEPTDFPSTFVVKLPAHDPAVRERVAFGYRAEVAFYASVAPTLSVPLPKCHRSAISEDAQNFLLLLDDLAPAVQGDQLAGCSLSAASIAVAALGGLHGPRWCDEAWIDFTATVMPKPDAELAKGLADLARFSADAFLERLGDRMTDLARETVGMFPDFVARWLLLHPDRFALLHGDYRLDNLMFSPDGSVIVIDWQTISVGLPARDLAYFLSTSLLPDDRAAGERKLVATYYASLQAFGVTDYSADECWRDYCVSMLHGPLITTLGAAFSSSTDRGDAMALVMLERSSAAIRHLKTLNLIEFA